MGAFFRLPTDTKDYLWWWIDIKDKSDIGNCFNQSKSATPLLKTLPFDNAFDNQSDKLVTENVAFADLGSCSLSDIVQYPHFSLANAKTQTQYILMFWKKYKYSENHLALLEWSRQVKIKASKWIVYAKVALQ